MRTVKKQEPAGKFGRLPGERISTKPKEILTYALGACSLGNILTAVSDLGTVSIMLGTPASLVERLQTRFPKAELIKGGKPAETALKRALATIENPAIEFDLPLDMRGTDFQRRVWRAVRKLAPGETTTYMAVARAIGAPRAMRAVGSSCTNNNFFMIIPCHRVLHSDGSRSPWQQKFIDYENTAYAKGAKKRKAS